MATVLARGLGWLSAGLGAAFLVAPRTFLTLIGIRRPGAGSATVARLVGFRELGAVPGLLAASAPVGWLAARIAGDVMDLALLRVAAGRRDASRGRLAAATAVVAGIMAIDVGALVAARRLQRERSRNAGLIVKATTVGRPADELYAYWRDLENLPRIMPHLESVEAEQGGMRSHWVTRGPFGTRVEWDAEIVDDRPAELLSWRSVDGAVPNAGTVRFAPAPAGRGTEVTVEMAVATPGGPLGTVVAMVGGEDPEQQVADALRRFKQVMEVGEPIASDATATGHKVMQRPAQPLEDHEREEVPA